MAPPEQPKSASTGNALATLLKEFVIVRSEVVICRSGGRPSPNLLRKRGARDCGWRENVRGTPSITSADPLPEVIDSALGIDPLLLHGIAIADGDGPVIHRLTVHGEAEGGARR